MTAQFQFFQSLPHKKADFVKKNRQNMGYQEYNTVKTQPVSMELPPVTHNPDPERVSFFACSSSLFAPVDFLSIGCNLHIYHFRVPKLYNYSGLAQYCYLLSFPVLVVFLLCFLLSQVSPVEPPRQGLK